MFMLRLSLVLFALGLMVGQALAAHDFWIEPHTFTAAAGTTVALELRVGEHLEGDRLPAPRPESGRFLPGPGIELRSIPGARPAAVAGVVESGARAIGYTSEDRTIELPAEEFESYLREEGLEHALEERRRRGEEQRPGREKFSRSVKTVLSVGGAAAHEAPLLGLPFELQLEGGPGADGSTLVRALFRDRPLAAIRVVALAYDDPSTPTVGRTDEEGRVQLTLSGTGPWLVKAVHIERLEDPDADWKSWWASVTFATTDRVAGAKHSIAPR